MEDVKKHKQGGNKIPAARHSCVGTTQRGYGMRGGEGPALARILGKSFFAFRYATCDSIKFQESMQKSTDGRQKGQEIQSPVRSLKGQNGRF